MGAVERRTHGLVIMSRLILKRQFLYGKECKLSLYVIDGKDYYVGVTERARRRAQDRAKDVLVHPSSLLREREMPG